MAKKKAQKSAKKRAGKTKEHKKKPSKKTSDTKKTPTNPVKNKQKSFFKQSLVNTVQFLKLYKQAFMKIVFFNILFWVVLYYEMKIANQWIGSVIPYVKQSAETSLFEVIGIVGLMVLFSALIPVTLYSLFRWMITLTIKNKPVNLKKWWKQILVYIVVGIILAALSFFFVMFLGMMRKEVIPFVMLIIGVPLVGVLYAWCQSLANNIDRVNVFQAAHLQLNQMIKLSVHVLGGAILSFLGLALLFYVGGSLWLKTLPTPDTAWMYISQYTIIFNSAVLLLTMIIVSVGQIHCTVNARLK